MPGQRPIRVVFVHGFISSAQVWEPFTRLIEEDQELLEFVTFREFVYDSPLFSPALRLRPDRRIPDLNDLADLLHTYLTVDQRDAESIVLVTHSQGGLIVQRYLARTIRRSKSRELARIKRIIMFACPNTGSEFALSLRKAAAGWRNPQEAQLRPVQRDVIEAQETVLNHVVRARGYSDTDCPIPIAAYGGASDNIVPPAGSTWVFESSGIIEGDHFSVVRPAGRDAQSYVVLKRELLAAGDADDGPEATGETATEWPGSVSITPPYGQLDHRLQGRDELIGSLMPATGVAAVHVLAGLGGSGKSRLALEIAYRAREGGRQVWWVSMTRINSCMREVANQLGAPESQVERAWRGAGSATDLVWRLLNACQDPWLLIFDNADDPRALGPDGGEVSDGTGWLRLPGTPNGVVIVTSRNHSAATWGSWSAVHPVRPLDDDDGAAMLMEHVGSAGETFEQGRLLSAELGGLPLALRAAADYVRSVKEARIWHGGTRITDFASYRAAVSERFEHPPSAQSGGLDELLGLELMREVSDLSLELLAQRGLTQAAPLLKLFACLSIAPIPYHVLLSSVVLAQSPLFAEFTVAQQTIVLTGLEELGLVEVHVLDGVQDQDLSHVLSLHPVVHGILRSDDDVQARRADYYGLNARMLQSATRELDPDYAASWPVWGIVVPHSLEIARQCLLGENRVRERRVILSALDLARLTARYLIVTGLPGPAHALIEPIIDSCEAFGFRRDDREILALRHERGRIALERGEPAAAEAELRQVVAGRERVLGENHHDTLASRHKLGKAVLEQGRWAEAESLLAAIVRAERLVRGPEHADTMVVRHSLARAILAQGRAGEAEVMIRDILDVRDRIWPANTPETLSARQTLARCLLEQGRAKAAEEEIRHALEVGADQPDAPIVLSLRHTLVTVLLMDERVADAADDLERLLADRRRVLGPVHPETVRTQELLTQTRPDNPDN